MLIMVMLKPIQLTMVREVPLRCWSQFCATRVENKGESATTLKPHIRSVISAKRSCSKYIANGAAIQQVAEMRTLHRAIEIEPCFKESFPESTHAKPPIPMIINDHNELSST